MIRSRQAGFRLSLRHFLPELASGRASFTIRAQVAEAVLLVRPFPVTIQNLIGAVLGNATRLGFDGRFRCTREGDVFVLTLRVWDIDNTISNSGDATADGSGDGVHQPLESITIGEEPTDDDYGADAMPSGFHALRCPRCWALTGTWLGRRTDICVVCGQMFKVSMGDA